MKKETAVVIGGFQPLHDGELKCLREALANSDAVVVILGSSRTARSTKHAFKASERREMIEANLAPAELEKLRFTEVPDLFYKQRLWIEAVYAAVHAVSRDSIVLYRSEADFKDFDANWFPAWRVVKVPVAGHEVADQIRENYLRDATSLASQPSVSAPTIEWLRKFAATPEYAALNAEQKAVDEYREKWSVAPYPPIFVTVDALVVQAGHLLMIRRKNFPGRGQWALAGGFLNADEKLIDGAVRELVEETAIALPEEDLRGCFRRVQCFDHPLRSARGRTITHAHLFELQGTKLAGATASDDAAELKWIPFAQLDALQEEIFEDHYHIIRTLLG